MTVAEFEIAMAGKRRAKQEQRALRANQTITLARCWGLDVFGSRRMYRDLVGPDEDAGRDVDLDAIADLIEKSHQRARAAEAAELAARNG